MLGKFTLFLLLLFCSLSVTAQDEFAKTIFVKPNYKEVVTIEANIHNQSQTTIEALEDELYAYEEKVLDVQIDQNANVMRITYNHFMLLEDLRTAFENQGIPYFKSAQQIDNPFRSTATLSD